jgi:peroxiredoxin
MASFIAAATSCGWARAADYNRRMSLGLKVGDPLPSVGLRASDGYLLNLRSFVTKQPAVFLFFGAPTMSGAARRRGHKAIEALVAAHDSLREAGIAVVGVSCDSEQQQLDYIESASIPFLLFSDERRSAAELLGIETVAAGANVNVARPVAVAVDRDGIARAIIEKVDPERLADDLLRALSEPIPAGAA